MLSKSKRFYSISTYELYVLKPNNLKGVIGLYGLFKFFLSKVRFSCALLSTEIFVPCS